MDTKETTDPAFVLGILLVSFYLWIWNPDILEDFTSLVHCRNCGEANSSEQVKEIFLFLE